MCDEILEEIKSSGWNDILPPAVKCSEGWLDGIATAVIRQPVIATGLPTPGRPLSPGHPPLPPGCPLMGKPTRPPKAASSPVTDTSSPSRVTFKVTWVAADGSRSDVFTLERGDHITNRQRIAGSGSVNDCLKVGDAGYRNAIDFENDISDLKLRGFRGVTGAIDAVLERATGSEQILNKLPV